MRDFEALIELTAEKAKRTQSLLAKKNYSNMDYNANWQRFSSCFMTNKEIFWLLIVSKLRAEGSSVLFTFVLYWWQEVFINFRFMYKSKQSVAQFMETTTMPRTIFFFGMDQVSWSFISRCSSCLLHSCLSGYHATQSLIRTIFPFGGALRHIPKDSFEGDYRVPGIERLLGQLGRALLAVALVER